MSRLIEGRYIRIHERSIFFSHVTEMLLYHYDRAEHADKVVILGDYITEPIASLRALYPGARLVAYQLEQLVGSSGNWHPVERTIDNLRAYDEIWEFDALNVKYLSWYGVSIDRLVPIRYTPSLRLPESGVERDIDLLFYGFINPRRFRFLERLQSSFYGRLRWVHAYGIFGTQLDELLLRSRVVLNLHAFEPYHRQEQVRIFYPLINARCVLSEESQLNWFGSSIVECTLQTFPAAVEGCLDRWEEAGIRAAEQFRERTLDDTTYEGEVARYLDSSASA